MYYIFYLTLLMQLICSNALTRQKAAHSFDVVGILNGFFSDIQVAHQVKQLVNHGEKQPNLDELHLLGKQFLDSELISSLFSAPNNQCKHDIMYISEGFSHMNNSWALHMLDSIGKMQSGILEGNFRWIGDFNECRNVYAPPKTNSSMGGFHGQYCLLSARLKIMNQIFPLTVGVCLPETCDPITLENDLGKLINDNAFPFLNELLDGLVNSTSLDCHANSKPLTSGAISMIVFFSFFFLLSFIGSSITTYQNYFVEPKGNECDLVRETSAKSKEFLVNGRLEAEFYRDTTLTDAILVPKKTSDMCEGIKKFFQCFCIFTNGGKLLDISCTEGQILPIHGIRFLSMTWVIVCHVYAFGFSIVDNLVEAGRIIDNWPYQIILQGFYSVDSFFVLSGFLQTYSYFEDNEVKNKKTSWLIFYIHRYIRLTPVYMIVVGFATFLFPYMGSGPFWPKYDTDPICKDYWWWNLLYINNFSPTSVQCVSWSWYLANDMQFFAISPLFLITLRKWPRIGFSLLGLFLFGTFAATFSITYHYNLISGLNMILDHAYTLDVFLLRFKDFFNKIYIKPYGRIGPYLIGLALGYLLFKRKQSQKGKDSTAVLTIGWIVSITVTLTCIYGLYHRDQSLLEISIYNALNRTCYAACLAWVMYVCLTDQGGPVNAILSYKLFMPLGRLTYCAYLIHPLVVTGYFLSLKSALVFSHATIVTIFLGMLMITYALSLVACLLFESPIIQLEKFFMKKLKKK